MQAQPSFGQGGPISCAFPPREFLSKHQFKKKMMRLMRSKNLPCDNGQDVVRFIEGPETGFKFFTLSGNNRRAIQDFVRLSEDVTIKAKAQDQFFTHTLTKLAVGAAYPLQKWFAHFDNKQHQQIVRDTPLDRCSVSIPSRELP